MGRHEVLERLGDGTTLFETQNIPLLSGAGIVLARNVVAALPAGTSRSTRLIVEFLCMFVPTLLGFTVLADYVFYVNVTVISVALFIIYVVNRDVPYTCQSTTDHFTLNRATLMVLTTLAILAVDFRIFPRRYAKTHAYGISPMDIGTGSFVFLIGYGAALFEGKPISYKTIAIQGVLLFVLGAGKLVVVALGYPLEVTEYGMHWNFFWTLMVLRLMSVFPSTFSLITSITAVIVFAAHPEWADAVLHGPPDASSFITANRDGLMSLFGYLLIADLSFRVARDLIASCGRFTSKKAMVVSTLFGGAFYALYYATSTYLDVYGPSRRIGNLSYVALSMSCASVNIGLSHFATIMSPVPQTELDQGMGRRSLPVFLAANVMTGIVNICINTEAIENGVVQFFILLGYAAALSVFILGFKRVDKLWSSLMHGKSA